MKRAMILPLLLLCGVTTANAETYRWTDAKGVVSFTDNPSLIPSRYRGKAVSTEDITNRNLKERRKNRAREEKNLQDELTAPMIVTNAETEPPAPASTGTGQPFKGHLSGDQVNPAPPSMKQPVPAMPGDQPEATESGMKQPIPVAPGKQPKPAPAGMKQPKAAPLGDQPKATPLGMDQPIPAR
ncbi:MAG: DUF4124 domain-containing protein [Geobacteraceae bacterium]|nr:DUF4124 domain-containing protein [Geobacteraceae bacterium]